MKPKKQTDQFTNENIRKVHNEMVGSMGLPLWAMDLNCSECGDPLEPSAVRGLGIKTNAQHFGNVVVDICCTKCNAGYELHYKNCCQNRIEFIALLRENHIDAPTAMGHEIKPDENNLVNKILAKMAKEEKP